MWYAVQRLLLQVQMKIESHMPEVRAVSAPWNAGIEFLIRDGDSVATEIIMKQIAPEVCPNSSFRLSVDRAQILMDDLWNCGLRPTEGHGSSGQLAATQRHLEDMRKLYFDSIESRKSA